VEASFGDLFSLFLAIAREQFEDSDSKQTPSRLPRCESVQVTRSQQIAGLNSNIIVQRLKNYLRQRGSSRVIGGLFSRDTRDNARYPRGNEIPLALPRGIGNVPSGTSLPRRLDD